ncbi:PGN_0703 family putative restriction endonuclease [Mesorhizobium amorphae]|uniref:Restriction endonuclease n=1 Tax=Mesorhizobium amorphae CCNWGS0123 TaxID=1082933 RepID=G6YBP4_9HYPH|nr:hypothetical protein [Mesorhizobium amorphae]ANT49751.1 hypothetical protein A6B35_07265 [Mesorhizobium amorphae CCNWGS0123]EHH10885.1 hypothetical protein MEA186_16852 [Mesorhizobium amorphae CCNWGS0123]GLR40123.1 hypothetical protein GCM10007880_06390 [Mesorhizobium amorphae]
MTIEAAKVRPVSASAASAACRTALASALLRYAPHLQLSKNGYTLEMEENLISGVRPVDFVSDLMQGDGNELGGKFRAAHSSSALAVNTFAPFKADPSALRLPGGDRFTHLSFERKCPHGLRGRRSPNLDLVAEHPGGIVAVESKFLEPLSPHKPGFAPAYFREITDSRRDTGWFAEMTRLTLIPSPYRWLDAAQLIKHALGISYTFPDRPTTLLYLFWEPLNPNAHPVFEEHRREIREFAHAVNGNGGPVFAALSYPDLWASWEDAGLAGGLQGHLARLRSRYAVSILG